MVKLFMICFPSLFTYRKYWCVLQCCFVAVVCGPGGGVSVMLVLGKGYDMKGQF